MQFKFPSPRTTLVVGLLALVSPLQSTLAQDPWIFDVRLEDFVRAAHGRLAISARNLKTENEFSQFAEVAAPSPLAEKLLLLAAAEEERRAKGQGLDDAAIGLLHLGVTGTADQQASFRREAATRAQALGRKFGLEIQIESPASPPPASPRTVRDIVIHLLTSPEFTAEARTDLRRVLLTMPGLTCAEELPLHLLNGGLECNSPVEESAFALFVDTPTGLVVVAGFARDYVVQDMVRGFFATLARAAVRRLAPGSDRLRSPEGRAFQAFLLDEEVAGSWTENPRVDGRDPPFERTRFRAGERAAVVVLACEEPEPLLLVRWHLPGEPPRTTRAWGLAGPAQVRARLLMELHSEGGAGRVEIAFAGFSLGTRSFEVSPRAPR